MIVVHRRICKAVKGYELLYIVPNSFIVCMEYVGTIFIDMNAFNVLSVHITR